MFLKWRLERLQVREAELKAETIADLLFYKETKNHYYAMCLQSSSSKLAKVQMKIKLLQEKINDK